jgi:hypothetical protein
VVSRPILVAGHLTGDSRLEDRAGESCGCWKETPVVPRVNSKTIIGVMALSRTAIKLEPAVTAEPDILDVDR